jgi:hypothetical protein
MYNSELISYLTKYNSELISYLAKYNSELISYLPKYKRTNNDQQNIHIKQKIE